MAYLAAINWLALAFFSALILNIALFGLSLSGHFPSQAQKLALKDWPARILLIGCILVVALCTAKTIGLALKYLPAPVAIIGAGAALLTAPQLLPRFPDRFVDSRLGLALLAGACLALVALAGRWLAP